MFSKVGKRTSSGTFVYLPRNPGHLSNGRVFALLKKHHYSQGISGSAEKAFLFHRLAPA